MASGRDLDASMVEVTGADHCGLLSRIDCGSDVLSSLVDPSAAGDEAACSVG